MRRSLVVLFSVALAVLAAGCGDQTLSRSEFVSKADAICSKYDKRLEALPEPKSIDDVGALADKAIPIVEDGIGELDDLDPPEELKGRVDRWLDLNKSELENFKRLRDAARKGDATRTQSLATQISATEKQADAAAREIGLKECGQRP